MQHQPGSLAARIVAEAAAIRQYERMVQTGSIDPACTICQDRYGTLPFVTPNVFGPTHKASSRCQSGKRPHCTCDTCF